MLVRSLSSFGQRRVKRILTCSHAIECSFNLCLAPIGEDRALVRVALSLSLSRVHAIHYTMGGESRTSSRSHTL
jgi:hypothetical protein